MRKKITKTIAFGLLVSFLAGTIFTISILIYYDAQTSNYHEDGRPKMNCFPGLAYGIVILTHVFVALLSLFSFLNLYQKVRDNKLLSFLSFFGGYLLYVILILINISEFSAEDTLIFIPWIYGLLWIYFYFKLKKIIKLKADNL